LRSDSSLIPGGNIIALGAMTLDRLLGLIMGDGVLHYEALRESSR
jgi:hypothetical protein